MTIHLFRRPDASALAGQVVAAAGRLGAFPPDALEAIAARVTAALDELGEAIDHVTLTSEGGDLQVELRGRDRSAPTATILWLG
jgi:hypothetical protein